MATSYVEFRRVGFWCDDSILETWLSYFLQVLDGEENLAEWLQQVQADWRIQATAGFMGCIDLRLHEVATNQERINILMRLAAQTNHLLASEGEVIPAEVLNYRQIKPADVTWAKAVATAVFLKVGQLFTLLLEGKLQTTSSSPPDYPDPEAWRKPLT